MKSFSASWIFLIETKPDAEGWEENLLQLDQVVSDSTDEMDFAERRAVIKIKYVFLKVLSTTHIENLMGRWLLQIISISPKKKAILKALYLRNHWNK